MQGAPGVTPPGENKDPPTSYLGEKDAAQAERMTAALIDVICQPGRADNTRVMLIALGAAAGSVARSSGNPMAAMELIHLTAMGVIDGRLLEH